MLVSAALGLEWGRRGFLWGRGTTSRLARHSSFHIPGNVMLYHSLWEREIGAKPVTSMARVEHRCCGWECLCMIFQNQSLPNTAPGQVFWKNALQVLPHHCQLCAHRLPCGPGEQHVPNVGISLCLLPSGYMVAHLTCHRVYEKELIHAL